MFDEVPVQVWLLVGIAAVGFQPARYLVEHHRHSPSGRDITQPPEDLAWRTNGKLALNLAIVAGLFALAIFIFTPAAARFARSAFFLPALLSGLGTFALSTVVRGFMTGRISPLIRGFSGTYERETQPKRYWASFAWNAAFGCMALVLAPVAYQQPAENACDNYTENFSPQEQLEACNELIAEGASGDPLANLFADRGVAYHKLGQYERAASDYTHAIEFDPEDSYSLYNRALVRRQLNDFPGAVEDLDASLRLRPDNKSAFSERGLLFLDVGAFDRAVADFTRAHELDPENHWHLANRGIAYAWMNQPAKAETDFATVAAADPTNNVLWRGRAVLARHAGDQKGVIAHLTKALEHDPLDAWALKMRADTYWNMGLHDLARDDDERLNTLRERSEQSHTQ